MQVRVYRNLHKKCWSVQAKGDKGWRVVLHLRSLVLMDVEFKVSRAGRERVLREKKKNVHAFAVGTLQSVNPPFWHDPTTLLSVGTWDEEPWLADLKRSFHKVWYDPYESPYFKARHPATGEVAEMDFTDVVVFSPAGVFAWR